MCNQLPTKQFLTFGRNHWDAHCPRCHNSETTIHILRDCSWAKEVWSQSPGILPLSFFHMPLQDWLRCNATADKVILTHHLPWNVYFPFMCWKLWLAQNERIFKNKSRSQHSLIYASVQAATEFYFLVGTVSRTQVRFLQFIQWHASPNPSITLNTDGSALSNLGVASAGGILHLGIATNNMAELVTIQQGLVMAWQLGFKFIQIELDSKVVLTWLTKTTMSYPTDMMSLICYCRSLMDWDWVVQVQHIYHEANACADALAKRGTHQQELLSVYNGCPSFVYMYYVKDLANLGSTRLYA